VASITATDKQVIADGIASDHRLRPHGREAAFAAIVLVLSFCCPVAAGRMVLPLHPAGATTLPLCGFFVRWPTKVSPARK
jgi:hypothetical protein